MSDQLEFPKSLKFDDVNDYVHHYAGYEDLQALCLSLSLCLELKFRKPRNPDCGIVLEVPSTHGKPWLFMYEDQETADEFQQEKGGRLWYCEDDLRKPILSSEEDSTSEGNEG